MIERLARFYPRLAPKSPETMLVSSFAGLIGIGTVFLWLPWSHHGAVGFIEALFTAVSAVCVTGLVVVDTGKEFTLFGQVVILLLIQTGGLGVMTFAALAFQLFKQRLSLTTQAVLNDTLVQKNIAGEFKQLFGRIIRVVLVIEVIGALLLYLGMLATFDVGHSLYSAIFHSVSAFCNAGFSIYSDSLMGFGHNPIVIATVMALILLGGIGHPVLVDIWETVRRDHREEQPGLRRLTLHSIVALLTSAALVVLGMLLLLLFGLTPGEPGWSDRLAGALFQSVTARTAGFNTLDIGGLPLASLFLLTLLMFIGGSPGSCAGGVKTTTFALWLSGLWAKLRGQKKARMFARHIPEGLSNRATIIIGLAVIWNVAGLLLLLKTEADTPGAGMQDVLFEQVSAFGTVGLSTGLTPNLSTIGRLWIIATMFIGRIGPLTLAMSLLTRRTPEVRYPEGRVMIG